MTKLVNLTPHAINLVNLDNEVILTLEPSGKVARCSVTSTTIGDINGFPLTSTEFGGLIDMPEDTHDGGVNEVYIVSQITANHPDNRHRYDVVFPNELVRDEKGNIIGCKSFGAVV